MKIESKKLWKFLPEPSKEDLDKLSDELQGTKNEAFLKLLLDRGIRNFEEAKSFIVPEIENLHDPFLMQDMDKAVERLSEAIESGEKILVYGDYDVDGTTAVAVFYSFISEIGADSDYYIPDRFTEGYGVSQAGIEYARDNDYSLIVSLDCGVKSKDKVALAKAHGIDFIICDHHLPDEENLPDAVAVLDPKRENCQYPFKELTGCGVGFKLLQAFCLQHDLGFESLFSKLDLLVLSIGADIVPMVGENRTLAYFGLKVLENNPNPGIAYLLRKAGKKAPFQVSDLVFGVAPVINAAGRMDHAHEAVKVFLALDILEAENLANVILKHNEERRLVEKSMVADSLQYFESLDQAAFQYSTVVFNPNFNKGVVGIVASKIQDKYYRPTLVLTQSGDKIVGSARSVKGFDIHHALEECSDLLVQFGGHTHAAGLTLHLNQLEAFREKFERVCKKGLEGGIRKEVLIIDHKIPIEAVNLNFYDKFLTRLSPFGPDNMEPIFVSEGLYICEQPFIMKEVHIKLKVGANILQASHEAVSFFSKEDYYEGLMEAWKSNIPIKIAYHMNVNEFNNRRTIQLMVKDFAV